MTILVMTTGQTLNAKDVETMAQQMSVDAGAITVVVAAASGEQLLAGHSIAVADEATQSGSRRWLGRLPVGVRGLLFALRCLRSTHVRQAFANATVVVASDQLSRVGAWVLARIYRKPPVVTTVESAGAVIHRSS